MSVLEVPVLSVKQMNKQYGNGCSICKHMKLGKVAKNYCHECGTVYACRDVTFDLYHGEVLGIVGESGSGKSTLMKSLYFDEEVTDGEMYVAGFEDGKRIYSWSQPRKKIRSKPPDGEGLSKPDSRVENGFLLDRQYC